MKAWFQAQLRKDFWRNTRGQLIFVGAIFLAYLAYRILTPPVTLIQESSSPDGSRTLLLRKIYYTATPDISIALKHGIMRQTIHYFSPPEGNPEQPRKYRLRWAPDSQGVFLQLNGTNVWAHQFQD